jgi:hypothetical protein
MAGILQAKKDGYDLDMGGFWPGDKFRIIADILILNRLISLPFLPFMGLLNRVTADLRVLG